MAHDAAFPHLFQSLANQLVLIGMQLDVIGDRLIDEIAAWTFLRGGQRIKCFNLFSDGTETDGFFIAAHNARTITRIILYYNVSAWVYHKQIQLKSKELGFSGKALT